MNVQIIYAKDLSKNRQINIIQFLNFYLRGVAVLKYGRGEV